MITYDINNEDLTFCAPCHDSTRVQKWLESVEDRIVYKWYDDHGHCSNCHRDF